MGEISGNATTDVHQTNANADSATTGEAGKVETGVEGVYADGVKKIGNEEYPVFNVDQQSFYQNMTHGRKRVRFPSGSSAQKFMQGMKYNKKFFISYTDPKSKETWTRKVK